MCYIDTCWNFPQSSSAKNNMKQQMLVHQIYPSKNQARRHIHNLLVKSNVMLLKVTALTLAKIQTRKIACCQVFLHRYGREINTP